MVGEICCVARVRQQLAAQSTHDLLLVCYFSTSVSLEAEVFPDLALALRFRHKLARHYTIQYSTRALRGDFPGETRVITIDTAWVLIVSYRNNIAQYLIREEHCNPSCENNIGRTPLHYACMRGHVHIVEYLIVSTVADTLIKDRYGCTAVYYAKNNSEIMQLFEDLPMSGGLGSATLATSSDPSSTLSESHATCMHKL